LFILSIVSRIDIVSIVYSISFDLHIYYLLTVVTSLCACYTASPGAGLFAEILEENYYLC